MYKFTKVLPEYLSTALTAKITDEETPHDWSEEILIYLALAYRAARRLEKTREELFTFENRKLIFPALERVWRETLHIRLNQPAEDFENSSSPVKLTRFGHIEEHDSHLD